MSLVIDEQQKSKPSAVIPVGRILLVEDNPAEQRLALEAFKISLPHVEVYVVSDVEEAVSYLRGLGRFYDSPLPHLILLDLNLPKKDGRQVLSEIKGDPLLRQIPIVVLTSSQSDLDIQACYSLHANSFVTKPLDLESFFAVIRDIERFWFGDSQLPKVEKLNGELRQRQTSFRQGLLC